MASAFPQPAPPSMAPAVAAAAAAASASSSSPLQISSAAVGNSFRLKNVVERITHICKGSSRFDPYEFFHLCFALARGIDYALTINDVPAVAHRLPSLIKQVYQRRSDISLQAAIMVLLISAKNACKNGWFHTADADELLSMANELCSSFCMTVSVTAGVCCALDIISKIVPRFYPQLKLCSLIVSFEAKPGYEILMGDFQIPRNIPPEEKISLIVVQTDSLETSSCIISPPQVSFLVNGKGVEKRTNVSLDCGPQFPTDISEMLKYGTNIIQAIGYFSGNYLIALAFMSKITSSNTPILKDYVRPVVAAVDADSEIIEGASRITLNCPIRYVLHPKGLVQRPMPSLAKAKKGCIGYINSTIRLINQCIHTVMDMFVLRRTYQKRVGFKRIKTPVKGHLCKHHQCFDYDNFMEMNSRKPTWRCPFCNQSVSCIDLRIDQNMVKILEEVGDIADVVISADGSWKAVVEHNGSTDQLHNGTLAGQRDGNMECESNRSTNALADAVDLTMEEDGKTDAAMSSRQVESLNGSINQSDNHAYETEDTKPFKHIQGFPVSQFLAEPPFANYASVTTQPPTSQIGNGTWPRVLSSTSASNGSLAPTGLDACAVGTSGSALPNVPVNPVITDAVSPALNQEPPTSIGASQPTFSYQHFSQVRQLAENMQLQYPLFGNSIISSETERPPIPRQVSRAPIAIQALPVQTQTPNSFKRMRINGPNSSSLSSNGSFSATFQTTRPMTGIPDGISAASDDMEMQQVLRTSDLSMTQDGDRQSYQHIPSPALQQVGLPAPNPISTRVPSTSSQPRGMGAYRASLQPPSHAQNPQSYLSNFRKYHTNHILSSTLGSSSGLHLGGISKELAAQHVAQQKVRLQAGAVNPEASRIAPYTRIAPSNSATADGLRLPGSEQSWNTTEPPSEQNWQPTGRMRGSLTGSAYSAALSQYLVPPTQLTPARPPVPSVPSTSDQLLELNANSVSGPVTLQANLRHGDVGSQPGGSSI